MHALSESADLLIENGVLVTRQHFCFTRHRRLPMHNPLDRAAGQLRRLT